MGASTLATQGIGRCVVCDVTDLSCCGRRLNTVLLLQEVDADVGIVEQECDEQVISNTPDAQRRASKCRSRNIFFFMKASLIHFDNWGHTCIRHCCNNFPDFVSTTKLYGIRTQYSTKIKKVSDAVDRREGDKNWREAWSWRFEWVVGVSEGGNTSALRGRPALIPSWDRRVPYGRRPNYSP